MCMQFIPRDFQFTQNTPIFIHVFSSYTIKLLVKTKPPKHLVMDPDGQNIISGFGPTFYIWINKSQPILKPYSAIDRKRALILRLMILRSSSAAAKYKWVGKLVNIMINSSWKFDDIVAGI